MYFQDTKDTWHWTNGDPVKQFYWDIDQPTKTDPWDQKENCILSNHGDWDDRVCNDKAYFICEITDGKSYYLW